MPSEYLELKDSLEHSKGLQHREAKHRVPIDRKMRSVLAELGAFAEDLHKRPTHLEEVIKDYPSGIGPIDASMKGM